MGNIHIYDAAYSLQYLQEFLVLQAWSNNVDIIYLRLIRQISLAYAIVRIGISELIVMDNQHVTSSFSDNVYRRYICTLRSSLLDIFANMEGIVASATLAKKTADILSRDCGHLITKIQGLQENDAVQVEHKNVPKWRKSEVWSCRMRGSPEAIFILLIREMQNEGAKTKSHLWNGAQEFIEGFLQ